MEGSKEGGRMASERREASESSAGAKTKERSDKRVYREKERREAVSERETKRAGGTGRDGGGEGGEQGERVRCGIFLF